MSYFVCKQQGVPRPARGLRVPVRRGPQARGRRVRGRVLAGLRARRVRAARPLPLRLRLRGRQLHHPVPVQRTLALRGARQARRLHRVPQRHHGAFTSCRIARV